AESSRHRRNQCRPDDRTRLRAGSWTRANPRTRPWRRSGQRSLRGRANRISPPCARWLSRDRNRGTLSHRPVGLDRRDRCRQLAHPPSSTTPMGGTTWTLDGIGENRELIASLVAKISNRPYHAYVFNGPASIGKALVAQALAHSLLCERTPGA